jgi:excinuclease ABC subunit B
VIDIFPAYSKTGYRIEFFGDDIDSISKIDITNNSVLEHLERLTIFPAKHFVTSPERIRQTIPEIKQELAERIKYFNDNNKMLEAYRIKQRTEYDIDMLLECGFCSGIENYSRYFAGRKAGERPATLFDFFPEDFLLFIDESHVTIPQIGGMYEGDRSRKTTLVKYGFRLPSALDNRPLVFKEFESIVNQVVYVSATPKEYELDKSATVVEQLIRPTGLLDPVIDVRKTEGQMDDLIAEIREVTARGERVLVTTLTKQMAEDLTEYLLDNDIKVNYMHSEIKTIERTEILRDLRQGKIDVLVGINLLREGLDLPEVSLVAILDADKIGFLRSTTSLVQIIGRAARNANGHVIMYADRMSIAMEEAIKETKRRREIQLKYNEEHGIVPKTIIKKIDKILEKPSEFASDDYASSPETSDDINAIVGKCNMLNAADRENCIKALTALMKSSAKDLNFEKAAYIRDLIEDIKTGF